MVDEIIVDLGPWCKGALFFSQSAFPMYVLRRICYWFVTLAYVVSFGHQVGANPTISVTFPCGWDGVTKPITVERGYPAYAGCGTSSLGATNIVGGLNTVVGSNTVANFVIGGINDCMDLTVKLYVNGQVWGYWHEGAGAATLTKVHSESFGGTGCDGDNSNRTYCVTINNNTLTTKRYCWFARAPLNGVIGGSCVLVASGASTYTCVTVPQSYVGVELKDTTFMPNDPDNPDQPAPGSPSSPGDDVTGTNINNTVGSNTNNGSGTTITDYDAGTAIYVNGTNGGIVWTNVPTGSGTSPLNTATFQAGASAIYDAITKAANQNHADLQNLLKKTNPVVVNMTNDLSVFVTNNNNISVTNAGLGELSAGVSNVNDKLAWMTNFFAGQTNVSVVEALIVERAYEHALPVSNAFAMGAQGLVTEYSVTMDDPGAINVEMGKIYNGASIAGSMGTIDLNPLHNEKIAAFAPFVRKFFLWLSTLILIWSMVGVIEGYAKALPSARQAQGSTQAVLGSNLSLGAAILCATLITTAIVSFATWVVGQTNVYYAVLNLGPFQDAPDYIRRSLFLLDAFFPIMEVITHWVGLVAWRWIAMGAYGLASTLIRFFIS